MKNLLAIVSVWTAFVTVAGADFRLGRIRPIMRAQLSLVEGDFFPRARTLALNKQDELQEPSSFTLVEDTGIRCIMAPCPSEKVTQFRIEEIGHSFHNFDVIRYEAVEIFTNIPRNVRMAPRRLYVTESSMELVGINGEGFERRTTWDVELTSFSRKTQAYTGNPEHLLVTASTIN